MFIPTCSSRCVIAAPLLFVRGLQLASTRSPWHEQQGRTPIRPRVDHAAHHDGGNAGDGFPADSGIPVDGGGEGSVLVAQVLTPLVIPRDEHHGPASMDAVNQAMLP